MWGFAAERGGSHELSKAILGVFDSLGLAEGLPLSLPPHALSPQASTPATHNDSERLKILEDATLTPLARGYGLCGSGIGKRETGGRDDGVSCDCFADRLHR